MNNLTKPPKYLYKILTKSQWDAMSQSGICYAQGSTSDQTDGYIHLSNAQQVKRIAKKYFFNESSVKILKLDYNKISHLIKWEPNSTGTLFPHCYNEISAEAVLSVIDVCVQDYDFCELEY